MIAVGNIWILKVTCGDSLIYMVIPGYIWLFVGYIGLHLITLVRHGYSGKHMVTLWYI